MRHLIRKYRNWRKRRLLRKLFWLYAGKTNNVFDAISQASNAFIWFTNEDTGDNPHVNYWWYK